MNFRKLTIFIIIFLSFTFYINSLWGEFVWDDKFRIVDNNYIKSLKYMPYYFGPKYTTMANLPEDDITYRPLVISSFAIDYKIWGLNPKGFHLTNVIFHLLNSILVFYIALHIFGDNPISYISGISFAIHPIHTESVNWIADRKDLLLTFFLLISFLLYFRYRLKNSFSKIFYLVFSLVSFIFALLSKEVGMSFPMLILMYEYSVIKREDGDFRKRIFHIIPFFVIAVLYILFRFFVINVVEGQTTGPTYLNFQDLTYLIPTILRVTFKYLKLLIVPFPLKVVYDDPLIYSFIDPYIIIGILLSISAFIIFWRFHILHGKTIFSFGWIVIGFLPIYSLVFFKSDIFIAERYLYFPSIGYSFLLAILINSVLSHKLLANSISAKYILSVFMAIIIVLSFVETFYRNIVWRDGLTLWTDAVRKSPNSSKARHNLGFAYNEKGLRDLAMVEYIEALKINPDYEKAHYNIGNIYRKKGMLDQAIFHYKDALRLNPYSAETHNNLGSIYAMEGRYSEAIDEFQQALKLDPDLDLASKNLEKALQIIWSEVN